MLHASFNLSRPCMVVVVALEDAAARTEGSDAVSFEFDCRGDRRRFRVRFVVRNGAGAPIYANRLRCVRTGPHATRITDYHGWVSYSAAAAYRIGAFG